MIVERTENPEWLSNAYLVADPKAGTKGVVVLGYLPKSPYAAADGQRSSRTSST